MISLVGVSIIAGLTGCDRNSKGLVPVPSDAFPGVIEIGEMAVLPKEAFNIFNRQEEKKRRGAMDDIGEPLSSFETSGNLLPSEVDPVPEIYRQACNVDAMVENLEDYFDDPRETPSLDLNDLLARLDADSDSQNLPCFFGQLGQSEVGTQGGATYTFSAPSVAASSEVCLMVDPETVFWGQSISPVNRLDEYAYPDFYNDDGDLDMFSGLSSYYNGSPGYELGDFKGFYTDSLGTTVEIEYGECFQAGAQSGMNDAHAGRATIENCAIEIDQREGIEYTVVLETFSVPLDDGILAFGAAVIHGRCTRLGPTECSIRGESLTGQGSTVGPRACTDKLEDAQCANDLGAFCCANPDMCGDNPPDDLCEDSIFQVDGGQVSGSGSARDKWCCMTDLCCDVPAIDTITGQISDECQDILGA